MNKIKKQLIFTVLIGAILLTACGVARSGIIGQWKQTDPTSGSTMYFEFKQDGKLRIAYDMDYQFVDDSTIVIKGSEGQGDTQMVWKVEGDKLSLIPAGGEAMVLDRLK